QMDWGELQSLDTALLPVEPFQATQVPTALGRYIYDIADRQQSSLDFVAISALCALAAVIGNGVRIAPKQHDDWQIVPNLWGAIIANPSTGKTPAMKAALKPLFALQTEGFENCQQQKEKAKIEEDLEILDKQEKKKQACKALKKGNYEAARAILSENISKNKQHDDCVSRFIVNDVTVEKLGELLKENPRGLLLVRDELSGFLANMERVEYQSERAFYLETFNGDGQFTYDRIGRGTIHIPNATLSIFGGIQPARITPLIRALHSGKGDDGLIQRFQMMAWPDENQEWKWNDRPPLKDAYKGYEEVFRSFRNKPLGSPKQPLVMHFSPKAQELFREWMEKLHRKAKESKVSGAFQAHLFKMPKTIPSLALIFELVEGGRSEITFSSLSMALRWEKYLLSHAKRLYAAGDTLAAEHAKLIVERCDSLPDVFTARDVYKRDWKCLKDKEAVKQALKLLCRTNHIREISVDNSSQGGRPTIHYEWHPLVKNQKTSQ
ncbi:YfjI family protein, partial [Bartonella vinsonii]